MHILFVLFITITCVQLCYYVLIFSRFSFAKQSNNQNSNLPVSVLICARNESNNLQQNLSSILNQNYTNFELVLINDGSHDDTLAIFESIKEKYKSSHQIKIVNVVENEKFWGSKKYALTLGIKAASNEYLLFTDADCQPASNQWISEMTSQFSEKKEIVLGYGAYKKVKNSFLNKIIRYETLYTALQYFSYAKIGLPYMGVGRNLAYKKSVFFKANGFAKHMHIKSGDDDLFINENGNKKNTTIKFSQNSFTVSEPKKTFSSWIHQKRRHIATANHYKPIHKLLLGLSYSTQLLFWLLASLLLILNYNWIFVLLIIGIRILFQYIVFERAAKKLNERDLTLWVPFFEIFLIWIQLFIFIKNKISKPTHW